jgi:hypothetical protein
MLRYLRTWSPEQVALYKDRSWAGGWLLDLLHKYTDEEIVRMPRYAEQCGNAQTRSLCSRSTIKKDDSNASEERSAADEAQQMLVSALDHLFSMTAFGIVEDMDRSALLIADRLGLPARKMSVRSNVTSSTTAQETLTNRKYCEDVSKADSIDNKLHQHALTSFTVRWNDLLSRHGCLDNAGGRDALAKQIDLSFRHTERGLTRLKILNVDPSFGMILDGWKTRYFYEAIQRWICWSESTTPRIWLPIDRSKTRRLEIDIAHTNFGAEAPGLQLEIDDEQVLVKRKISSFWRHPKKHLTLSAKIPNDHSQPQYTMIKFSLPYNDNQLLSVALSGIRVS